MVAKPVVVIVGPTASGKTGLAIKLAKQFDGEIICADSRTVYTGMDIGTAKPSKNEQDGIPHWGLDIAGPKERFTAAEFKKYANQKINGIRERGRVPFVVGGTGLYVDAVLFDYDFPKPISDEMRETLEQMSIESLHTYCIEHNIELPVDDKNKRRLIRAISDPDVTKQRQSAPIGNSVVVGIVTENKDLRARIHDRTEQMFSQGVVDEATTLAEKYGWDAEAMTSNVYRDIKNYLDGNVTLDETKSLFETRDWQLAKRQMTWFRRNPYIEWGSLKSIEQYVISQLGSE